MGILVDQTNLNAVAWVPYSSNISADLGTIEGWHRVDIALRGRTTNSPVTWRSEFFKFDATPPALVITSPTNQTLEEPIVELTGYSIEDLGSISFDLSNAAGQLTNQSVYIRSRFADTAAFETTTNFFAIASLDLTNGVNTVVVRAEDRAGNVSITNVQFTVDYSTKTNPPLMQIISPQNGDEIGTDNVAINGYVTDLTATVVAQMVNTNGTTNIVEGIVHWNHQFWVPYLPLSGGTNQITLTIKDIVGNKIVTNLVVLRSSLRIAMNPVSDEEIWKSIANVTGTISDSTYAVWVNGVKGHNNGNGTWSAAGIPIAKGGPAKFSIVGYSPSEQQPDGSYGN